jgi:L-iditol 2-dehydrogenase
MWAYVLDGPMRLERVEVPDPLDSELPQGRVLLRFLAGGLCGSDLPAFKGLQRLIDQGRSNEPVVGAPMHEIVGEVVRSNDPTTVEGSFVVGWAEQSNALAEYVVTGSRSVYAYRAPYAPEVAILIQPLACVLNAADRFPDFSGQHVAVIGMGPIGVLFAHVLKQRGAAFVTGVDRIDRIGDSVAFGVDRFVRLSSDRWANGITADDAPMLVVEAVGHQVATVRDAITAVAPHGHIFCFGIPDDAVYPFPMNNFLRKNLAMQAGVTVERFSALAQADAYLAKHPELASAYVTNVFPAKDAQAAFEAAVAPRPGQRKGALAAD